MRSKFIKLDATDPIHINIEHIVAINEVELTLQLITGEIIKLTSVSLRKVLKRIGSK